MTVTMEKRGEDSYLETWKKDGYTIVTSSNGDEVTTKFPEGKQVTVSFVNGEFFCTNKDVIVLKTYIKILLRFFISDFWLGLHRFKLKNKKCKKKTTTTKTFTDFLILFCDLRKPFFVSA